MCMCLGFLFPQCGRSGFSPWVGKIPWRRKWQPNPVFLPGESHGWRSLVGYSPWGRKHSEKTEQLHFFFFYVYVSGLPLPTMREIWVQSLGREDPLEEEMATQPSILAWRIPWMEEPGGLQSMGSQTLGED